MIKINFGDINKVILFGGGLFLRDVAKQLSNSGYEVVVFSAPRHLKEQWEGGRTLKELLIKDGIDFYEVEGISSKNDSYAFGLKFQTFKHHFELLHQS